jgi:transcriptional regulator with XRE-family HTH domain
MIAEWFSRKYRQRFVDAFVRQGVASQIQLLRKREGLSQKKLGEITDKKQNAIARLEDPSYGKFTLTTLLELANAFDVALSVRFIPFSELEEQTNNLTPEKLCARRFSDEFKASPAPQEISAKIIDSPTNAYAAYSVSGEENAGYTLHIPGVIPKRIDFKPTGESHVS